jgi:hypothetical protein
MELFAIKVDGQNCCQVVDNESMHIVGYLEQGEKGFYIHLKNTELLWEIIKEHSLQKRALY